MNMTKWHVMRILLCAFASVVLIHVTSSIIGISIYTIYSWKLFAIEQGITGFGENVPYMIISSTIWHYSITCLALAFLWKWVGFPIRFLVRRGKDENNKQARSF